jgi:biopolymer transport protein ExbD
MRRRHTRHRPRKPAELLLVPMIDIFTVLVTFLLMTAVFSRITILELDLPSSASHGLSAPTFRLEVIIRKEGLELTNGTQRIAVIPNVNGEYGLKTLSELALSLKRDYPDARAASVLLEPEIEYDHLIQVMDAIRTVEVPAAAQATTELVGPQLPVAEVQKAAAEPPIRMALFTDIAVGDAP